MSRYTGNDLQVLKVAIQGQLERECEGVKKFEIDLGKGTVLVGFEGGPPEGIDRIVEGLLPKDLKGLELEIEYNMGPTRPWYLTVCS